MEHEIRKILDEIETMGGLSEAIKKGWIDQRMEEAWLAKQQELEKKERIVVGVNAFTVEEDEDAPVRSTTTRSNRSSWNSTFSTAKS